MPTTSRGYPYPAASDPDNVPADMQALADALNTDLNGSLVLPGPVRIGGDYVAASTNGINGVAVSSGTDDTTSATYVNMAGTGSVTSFSFTKRFSSAQTRIRVEILAGLFAVTSNAVARLGVNINSVDYDVAQVSMPSAAANDHEWCCGVAYLTSIAAGTYTVQGRWRRVSGTGTCRRDTSDWLSITATEVSV